VWNGLCGEIPQTWLGSLSLVTLLFGFAAAVASAHGVGSATIQGNISDESGAVLPGVTVTLTSPALQVVQLTDVTDPGGS
jgi:hypothetical protein